MTPQPLPFDPIARAAELWEKRIGPSTSMARTAEFGFGLKAVTSAPVEALMAARRFRLVPFTWVKLPPT